MISVVEAGATLGRCRRRAWYSAASGGWSTTKRVELDDMLRRHCRCAQHRAQIDQRLVALLGEVGARRPIGTDADLAGQVQSAPTAADLRTIGIDVARLG